MWLARAVTFWTSAGLPKGSAHLQFTKEGEDDDIVHFEMGKYAKRKNYENKRRALAWSFKKADISD